MEYYAVGNRCAVNMRTLDLPVSDNESVKLLIRNGFKVLEVDLIVLARKCIKTSIYKRAAKPSEAPAIVDCSSFIKWLYGQRGIWLPRRSIQQRELGVSVAIDEISKGDIIFSSGRIDYYWDDPLDGVGHVGIATGHGTVIHAANREVNVIESSLESFVGKSTFRGARRYIIDNQNTLTFETPSDRGIEMSDDIRWIVLQLLTK